MTRRFLDDLRADVITELPDNITGDITPAIMRQLFTDTIDSTISDESLIAGAPAITGYSLGTTYTPFTTGFYDESAGGDGSFLTVNPTAGNITTSPTAGFSYLVSASVTVQASVNTVIEMAVMVNGIPSRFQPSITGRGTNDRPVSVYLEAFINGPDSLANTVIQISARAPDGITAISVDDIILGVAIKPTNDPA